MKTIELTDEDYVALMELCDELRSQPNHGQAFPHFWTPCSEKLEINVNGEGSVVKYFHYGNEVDPEDMFEDNDELREDFINYYLPELSLNIRYCELDESNKETFVDYLTRNGVDEYTYNWIEKQEINPSLFLSDVQNYVKTNSHHLGRNPTTYSNSVWRMPKMKKLIKILYSVKESKND